MLQTAEVLAGATGAATAFPVLLIATADGQPFTTATEANVEIRYCREGETAWTLLDDAAADNILADGGAAFGRYLQRTIAAPMAAAAGVGYVDFVFSGTGFFTQHVRVYLRPYDWRSAPLDAAAVTAAVPSATAIAGAVRDEMLSVRWGVQSQPSGGSTQTLTIADQPSGTTLGVVRRFWSGPNNTGTLVGQTELTVS